MSSEIVALGLCYCTHESHLSNETFIFPFAASASHRTGNLAPSSSQGTSVPQFSEAIVSQLMQNGFSRNAVLEELRRANGNADQALASLLAKSFSMP